MSLRNQLLNFRPGSSGIQLMVADLSQLEDCLAEGVEFRVREAVGDVEKSFDDNKIGHIKINGSVVDWLRMEFAKNRLHSYYNADETAEKIQTLYRKAKLSMEESGSNTLYLALGLLGWYETEKCCKKHLAPLVMLPLEIVKKSLSQGYVIRRRDEETIFNITLLEKLSTEYDIKISGLDPLPQDEHGVDLKKIFAIVRTAIMNKKNWQVTEEAFIGQFSFSQYIMWNDLCCRGAELAENKVVKSLIDGRLQGDFPPLEAQEILDGQVAPADLAVPLSADSSQLAAIYSAGQDCSFVLHGPPGTGKSQTITNMIANALYHGKTVLFIAEKMAALEVVQKCLAKIGLEKFCLELHSNKTTKSYVTAQLKEALEAEKTASGDKYAATAGQIHALRVELNDFMQRIHRRRESGYSLYEVICQYEKLKKWEGVINIPAEMLSGLTAAKRQEWEANCAEYALTAVPCGIIKDHELAEWRCPSYSEKNKALLGQLLPEYMAGLEQLASDFADLRTELPGLGLASRQDLTRFLELLGALDGVDYAPVAGLLVADQNYLDKLVGQVVESGNIRNSLQGKIAEQFEPEVFQLDCRKLKGDLKEAELQWFLPRYFSRRAILKTLARVAKTPRKLQADKLSELLDNLCLFREAEDFLKSQNLAQNIGPAWQGLATDWSLLEKQYRKARQLLRFLEELVSDPSLRLAAAADLLSCLQAALAYGLAIEYIDSDEGLRNFSGQLLDSRIAAYKDLNNRFADLTREELVTKLTASMTAAVPAKTVRKRRR